MQRHSRPSKGIDRRREAQPVSGICDCPENRSCPPHKVRRAPLPSITPATPSRRGAMVGPCLNRPMAKDADEPDIAHLGLAPWEIDGAWRETRVDIGPEAGPMDSDRPLTGVVFAWLDVVTGMPPSGAMNPTVDLQVRLFRPLRHGTVHFRARTLRLGRTLYVGEVEIRQERSGPPVGVALATFLNQPIPFPNRADPRWRQVPRAGGRPPGGIDGARRLSPGVLELDADLETPQGTVGGATLGRLVESAAVDIFDTAVAVDELDVRFLRRVRRGPIRTAARVVGRRDDATTVRVEVVDAGDDARLVTYALAVCRPTGASG
jgi:acyl-coenzyme A thioesterase PaaI-like protein